MTTRKCSGGRIAVLKALMEDGPTVWNILARKYYGEKRYAENKARTSFMNQISKLMGFGFIHKDETKLYSLTVEGKEYLLQQDPKSLDNAMSDAQIKWEAVNV